MTAALILLIALGQTAEAREATPERGQLGSLARSAAAIQNALDLYRLTLSELVPATHLLLEAAEAQEASPDTLIPEPAREVFKRLGHALPLRTGAESLPAVARGYHSEIVEALDTLALAQTLGETGVPLRELVRSLTSFERGADDILDLSTRQRPVRVQIVDPETALDDVGEALDEVAAAEQRIGDLRASAATPADQLRAFMRLDVALGHALDLIAAAEESGVRVGFDMQKPTLGFKRAVAEHAALRLRLSASVSAIAQPPQVNLGGVHAFETVALTDNPNVRQRAVELAWTQAASNVKARLSVERRASAEDILTLLVEQTMCEGASYGEAVARLREAPVQPSLTEMPSAVLADMLYRHVYTEPVGEGDIRSDLVLTPVSVFGIAGESVVTRVAYLPRAVHEARAVHAEHERLDARDPSFYRDHDTVRIRWHRAIGDVAPDTRLVKTARAREVATVSGYRVARIVGDRAIVVGKTAPGVTEIIDRPTLKELTEGVKYRVTALGTRGAEAAVDSCGNVLDSDIGERVALARAGAGALGAPARFERELEGELKNDVTREKAQAMFELRRPEERDALLAKWWGSIPIHERLVWLAHWPSFMSATERDVWLTRAHEGIMQRDFDTWVLPELFLADQPEPVRNEVDRVWELVGNKTRVAEYTAWLNRLSVSHRAYVLDAAKAGGDKFSEARRPVQVIVWWATRGEAEHQRAQAWWDKLDESSRRLRVQTWMGRLDPAVQLAVRWPDLETRSPSEREAVIATAYRDLPSGLYRRALAWSLWQTVDNPQRAGFVAKEVGAIPKLIANVAYAARPIDAAVGWNLRMFFVGSIFATVFAMAIKRVLRTRGALSLSVRPVVPEVNALAALTPGVPVVTIPGAVAVNDAQTLRGLLLLDAAAASTEGLVVASREPFVQHVGLLEGVSGAGYAIDEMRALVGPAMPFLPSARDAVTETRAGASLLLGHLPPETLLVSDALAEPGALVVATADKPFLAMTRAQSEAVFAGDEALAATADATREPTVLATLLATDWMKLAIIGTLVGLMLAASLGAFG